MTGKNCICGFRRKAFWVKEQLAPSKIACPCIYSRSLMVKSFTRKSKIKLSRHGQEEVFTLRRGLSVDRSPISVVDRRSHRVQGLSLSFSG